MASVQSSKIKQLRAEALAFAQNGDPRRALEKLEALEALEPKEPDWPHRAAECHRQVKEAPQYLAALARAAERYVGADMVVKALAICRMMLAADPQHPAALGWMQKLERPLGIPEPPRKRHQLPSMIQRPVPAVAPASSAQVAPNKAQRLVADRGLVAVARALARKAGRNEGKEDARRVLEVPPPPAPVRSNTSSSKWQAVDASELLEPDPSRPPQVSSAAPKKLTLSIPPLSIDAALHNVVTGSEALPGGFGKPSGMFRLGIDPAPPTRGEQTLRQAREILPAVPLFSELDPSCLESMVRQSRLVHLEPGDAVYQQDDAPDCLYVVVNGSVALFDEAERVELYRLSENEFFGEAALISNDLRPSTARAAEESDLLAFDRDAMHTSVSNNPRAVAVLLRFLRERMIEHLVRTSPLFTSLNTADRRSLSRRFEFIEVSDGALLLQQGTPSPGLFVLLSGAVDVIQCEGDRERWLATLERGGVFGEISMLRRSGAVADVRSVTPGFALMLPAAAFREVIMTHPPFLEVLTVLSEEREQANQRRLAGKPNAPAAGAA